MRILTVSAIFVTILIVIACHSAYKATDFSVRDVNSITANWPANTREASNRLINKLGLPDEITSTTLVWKDRDVWKKTVLMKEGIPHDWPMAHTDYLLQTINYKVPVDKLDELGRFDGSVIVDRTKGTLSARCDKEEMNVLALNLAHDIITDKKTVEEARDHFAKTATRFKEGDTTNTLVRGLQFNVSKTETGDRDMPATTMRESTESREAKEIKEAKERKDSIQRREPRDSMQMKEPNERKDTFQMKEPRERKDTFQMKEPGERKDTFQMKKPRERKDTLQMKKPRERKDTLQMKKPGERKDTLQMKEPGERKDQ